MMSVPSASPQVLDFFGTPFVIEPSLGQFSSDARLLPIRQFDDFIGLTRAFTYARHRNLTGPIFPVYPIFKFTVRPARSIRIILKARLSSAWPRPQCWVVEVALIHQCRYH
jgi:hypothetical protein